MPRAGRVKMRWLSTRRRTVDYVVEHSLLLPLGAAIALVWANVSVKTYAPVARALQFPINDVGMVFFFALATKEVVEATAPGGALHTWRHAAIPFLLLLAIADDAMGLVILALFYPIGDLHLLVGGALMAVAIAATYVIRRRRTHAYWPYIIAGGVFSWMALFWGGLHPALALVPI